MSSVLGQTVKGCTLVGQDDGKCIRVCLFHGTCIEKYRQLARSAVLDTPVVSHIVKYNLRCVLGYWTRSLSYHAKDQNKARMVIL